MPGHLQDRMFKSGYYYGTDNAFVDGASSQQLNYLYLLPFTVGKLTRFDRIGLYVTLGIALTTARLGIYRGAEGKPTGLLADYSTVDVTNAGAKEIVIDITLPRGLFWLAVVEQGVGGATYRTKSGANPLIATNNPAGGVHMGVGYYLTGVAGALPANFTVEGISPARPSLLLRAA